jgi:hypothetical protein
MGVLLPNYFHMDTSVSTIRLLALVADYTSDLLAMAGFMCDNNHHLLLTHELNRI